MAKQSKESLSREIFYYSSLAAIFAVMCVIFVGRQGHLIVDIGRSLYIPEIILDGKVLYKDIFVLYGPLSYQINALLYIIFGTHLNTLYFAGIANSFAILTAYYLISRKVTSISVSWLASFLLMVSCIFYYQISNYILPYSYSMVYAISAFLISVLLCIHYVEKSRPVFLILSALFMGISIANKLDFILVSLVLFMIAFCFKPLKIKHSILFIIAFAIVPVISWGIVFLQGLQIKDFLSYLQAMQAFLNAKTLHYFYSHYTGFYPSPVFIWGLKETFLKFLSNFSIVLGIFFTYFWIFSKIPGSKIKTVVHVIAFIVVFLTLPKSIFKETGNTLSLAWLAVSASVVLMLCFKDKILTIVAAAGVLAAVKSYFFVNLHVLGTYVVPLLLLVNLVFIFDKVPEFIRFLPEKSWKKACFTTILLIGIVHLSTNIDYAVNKNKIPVETPRGKIYTSEEWGGSLRKLVDYVNKEVPPNKTFVMMPEGLAINFLTDRDHPVWFHAFTPHFIEKFEEKIINNLEEKAPDYIFVTNQNTEDYYYRKFCVDYAKSTCEYIKKNYDYLEKLGNSDLNDEIRWVDIYRKK